MGMQWLVENLYYKPEGHGFYSRRCHWNYLLILSFRPYYGPGFTASNRYEYQECFLGGKGGQSIGLTLSPSCTDCHVIWEPQHHGTLRACNGIALYIYTRVGKIRFTVVRMEKDMQVMIITIALIIIIIIIIIIIRQIIQ
jgi:hypothetical protein